MRLNPLVAAALGAALLLAGCAPAPAPPAPAPAVISFGVFDYQAARYEPLIARFNQDNPDISVRAVSLNGLGSGVGDGYIRALASAADTFPLGDSARNLVAQGLVRDLAPFLDADASELREDFFPGAIRPAADGSIAVLPDQISLPLLAYNRDLWAERGLPSPRPDWTWEEAGAALRALARREGDAVATYGLMLATRADVLRNTALVDLAPLAAAPPERLRLDEPAIVAAAEETAALFRAGVVFTPPEYPDGTLLHAEDYQPLLREGRVGLWSANEVFLDSAEPLPYALGTAPFPLGAQTPPALRSGYAISAGTAHPEAAWRWITFLSAQGATAGSGPTEIPARPSAAEASGYWGRLDAEAEAAVRATLARLEEPAGAAQPAVPWPVRQAFAEALTAILDAGERPDAALRAAQLSLDTLLAEAPAPAPPATAGPLVVEAPPAEAAPGAARVTFLVSHNLARYQRLAERFNAEHPSAFVEVRAITFAPDEPPSIAAIAGRGDCFFGAGLDPAESPGALLDLQPLVDADPAFDRGDYPPGLLERHRRDGRLLTLPLELTPVVVGYDPAAFAAAGIAPPSAAWTAADLAAAAERLMSADGETGQYGYVPLSPYDLIYFVARSGVSLVRGQGDAMAPAYTDPAAVAAIGRYLELARNVAPPDALAGYTRSQPVNGGLGVVQQGRAALWMTYGFTLPTLSHDEAPLAPPGGLAPPPLGAAPLTLGELYTSDAAISAQSAHPEACWAWITFLTREPAVRDTGMPARLSVARSPAFLDTLPPESAELARAYTDLLAAGIAPAPYASDVIEPYWLLRAVEQAAKRGDLEGELAEAQRLTEAHLACVRGGAAPGACARQVDPAYDGWLADT